MLRGPYDPSCPSVFMATATIVHLVQFNEKYSLLIKIVDYYYCWRAGARELELTHTQCN